MVLGHSDVSPHYLDTEDPKFQTAGRGKSSTRLDHAEFGNPIVALAAMRGILYAMWVHWNVWLRVFVGTVSDIRGGPDGHGAFYRPRHCGLRHRHQRHRAHTGGPRTCDNA